MSEKSTIVRTDHGHGTYLVLNYCSRNIVKLSLSASGLPLNISLLSHCCERVLVPDYGVTLFKCGECSSPNSYRHVFVDLRPRARSSVTRQELLELCAASFTDVLSAVLLAEEWASALCDEMLNIARAA